MNRFNLKENEFDTADPPVGHEFRFQKKLEKEFSVQNKFHKGYWLAAASAIIVVSLGLGVFFTPEDNHRTAVKSDVTLDKNTDEAINFYQTEVDKQLAGIAAQYDDPASTEIIKESLELIQQLKKEEHLLEEDFAITADHRVASALLNTYKKRIEILQELIKNLNYINQLNTTNYGQSNT